jgi:transposase-like protein
MLLACRQPAGVLEMGCICCGSAAVTERPDRTAQGYRRSRCRDCGKQSNERSGGLLNRAQYPSDVVALVVLWRLRYRLIPGSTDQNPCAQSRNPMDMMRQG